MQKKLKIKKGDTVKVIAGAASGQQGVILDVEQIKAIMSGLFDMK